MLAVDPAAIEILVVAQEEQLHAARRATGEELRDFFLRAKPHIHRHAGVADLDQRVFANLAIVGQHDADFMTALPQLARQSFDHINEHGRSRKWRPFRADHQDAHSRIVARESRECTRMKT